MLPQLNAATFPSQIFWVVVGFFCVYGIMAFFAVPRLKKILDQRSKYVGNLLDVAKKFNEKSEKIEKEAEDLLTKTKKEILATEENLIGVLEKRSFEEKQRISKEILENANKEVASLKVSSEDTFKEMASNLDEFLDLALQKMRNQKS